MAYEFFYSGTPYSMEPTYKNAIGYSIPTGYFGMSTDPRTAAQLQEVSTKLSTGVKTMEIEGLSAPEFESIPEQHLDELNRLSKLTGVTMTLHGPLVEASGYDRQGNWSEAERQQSENQIKLAVERAHKIDPDGNIPVTFHSTALIQETMEKMKTSQGEKAKAMWIVDPRTGAAAPIKETERHFPGEPTTFDPKKELKLQNDERWTENVGQINMYTMRGEAELDQVMKDQENMKGLLMKNKVSEEEADKIAKEYGPKFFEEYANALKSEKSTEVLPDAVTPLWEPQFKQLDHAALFLKDSYRGLKGLYNMAYSAAQKTNNQEDLAKLEAYRKRVEEVVTYGKGIENEPSKLPDLGKVIQDGIRVLRSIETPQLLQPMGDFVTEKSSQTFATAALHGYKKFGDTAPIISIENPPVGSGISRAEDLKKLIQASREKFVVQAVSEGMPESEAKKASEKLIGATWDVGHINMIRKYGYDKNDVVNEAEIIKPFVKHVHLSDNFGMEHTELPMGMGNVPIKEIMEKLGKEGFEAKKIIEAGNWWQHFKTAPVVPTLEAFGSPLYPMLAGPSWGKGANMYGSYFATPSANFPDQHFALYGSGFASLPTELGGQIPGTRSRATGTPMD